MRLQGSISPCRSSFLSWLFFFVFPMLSVPSNLFCHQDIFKMKASDLFILASAFASCLSQGNGAVPFHPVANKLAASLAGPDGGNAVFKQLIDHSNPSLGTFDQWYWWNTTFWKGPGSPVCLHVSIGTANILLMWLGEGGLVYPRGGGGCAIWRVSHQPHHDRAVCAGDWRCYHSF